MKQGEWIVLTQYSCGCQVRKIRDKITKTFIVITYCPKHKAAPDMYGKLEELMKYCYGRSTVMSDDWGQLALGITKVLAKAEIKEER